MNVEQFKELGSFLDTYGLSQKNTWPSDKIKEFVDKYEKCKDFIQEYIKFIDANLTTGQPGHTKKLGYVLIKSYQFMPSEDKIILTEYIVVDSKGVEHKILPEELTPINTKPVEILFGEKK